VSELVFHRGEPSRLHQEVDDFQRPEPALELRHGHAGHRRQKSRRNPGTDGRGKLQQRLVLTRQTVDAGGDRALHRGRDFHRFPERFRCRRACARFRQPSGDQLARHFLDEERHLSSMAQHMSLEVVEMGAGAEHIVQQRLGRTGIERAQPDPAHLQPRKPSRRVLGPPRQHHQQRAARRERQHALDGGLALSVDPVQILQQQNRRPFADNPFDHVEDGISDHPAPEQRFEAAPARVGNGLIEDDLKRCRPEIGMRRRLCALGGIGLRQAARGERALQELLEQRKGNRLLQRIAIGFEDLPILLTQAADEFMRHARFADAGGPDQRNHLPRCADVGRRLLQLLAFFGTPDKGGETPGRTGTPARQSAALEQLVARHRRRKPFQPPRRQLLEDGKA
jgi:hypothetical protein